MDEVMKFLISINKISVLAFLITAGFLIYEFYLIQKEKQARAKPNIPNFTQNYPSTGKFSTITIEKTENKFAKKNNQWLMIILIIMTIFFAGVTLIGFFGIDKDSGNSEPVKIVYNELASNGIKLYTGDWQEIKKDDLVHLKDGAFVLIAVESIRETDIDRARIRVNGSGQWKPEDITVNFNQPRNVYYKNYHIATGAAQIKIEAQLHSAKDGWLGD